MTRQLIESVFQRPCIDIFGDLQFLEHSEAKAVSCDRQRSPIVAEKSVEQLMVCLSPVIPGSLLHQASSDEFLLVAVRDHLDQRVDIARLVTKNTIGLWEFGDHPNCVWCNYRFPERQSLQQ